MSIKSIKVASTTPVQRLAKLIRTLVEEGQDVELRAIGAGAVNQMYKGITTARGQLAQRGKDLTIRPGFCDLTDVHEGQETEMTAMTARIIID